MKKTQIFIIIGITLMILAIAINYSFFDNLLKKFLLESEFEYSKVERIIDGDTIEIENDTHVRLLGINSPERGEFYFEQAKEYLENLILNKTVELEFGKDKYDKYNRILSYVHINDRNVNLELVKEGFANFYFPSGKDIYYKSFKKAWEECITKNKNLCEKSENECVDCIILKEFNYENGIVIFYNKCSFDCSLGEWEIKDEGRKKFIFEDFVLERNKDVIIKVGEGEDNNNELYWKNQNYVWTKTGDSLFLRDDKNKLVLWRSY